MSYIKKDHEKEREYHMSQKATERSLTNEKAEHNTIKEKNHTELLLSWIRTVKFKESDKTAMNLKLLKHDDFLNARMLVKTTDYKQQDDSVTIQLQLTLKGLIEMNKFSYNAIKLIKEHIQEKEEKQNKEN